MANSCSRVESYIAYAALSRGFCARFQHLLITTLSLILQEKHCKQMDHRHFHCPLLAHILLIPSAQWGAVTEKNRANSFKIFQMKHEPALFPSALTQEIL